MALDTNLVAHYLLRDDTNDETGNYDGVNTGVTFDGISAGFNGSTSYISAISNVVSGDTTWSEWVKLTSATTTQMYTLGQHQTGSKNRAITYGTNLINGFSRDSGGVFKSTSYTTTDLEQESWTHIVFTQTGTVIRLYINGVLRDSLDMLSTYTFSTQLIIGQHADENNSGYLNGNISNVRIYSDGKDQAFVDDLFAEGYTPSLTTDVTASVTITATPLTQPITADVTASVNITATPLIKSYSSLFTVVQEIQHTSPETIFRVIQEIEQPITTTIIQRVNA